MLTWTCGCGAVAAEVPAEGTRVVCYCRSCRSFVERLGRAERLDAAGGNDLLQLSPDKVRFLRGGEHLAWMRLTPKGPLRWYTTCCNTPMANTLGTRTIPFAGFQTHDLRPREALPPVRARVHLKGATGPVDEPRGSVLPLVAGLLGRTVTAWLSGGWRGNPFFDEAGRPVAPRQDPPRQLT